MDFNVRSMLDERMANFLSADAHIGHDHAGNVLVNGEVLPAAMVKQIYGSVPATQTEVKK
jgi:hypothetical protein